MLIFQYIFIHAFINYSFWQPIIVHPAGLAWTNPAGAWIMAVATTWRVRGDSVAAITEMRHRPFSYKQLVIHDAIRWSGRLPNSPSLAF